MLAHQQAFCGTLQVSLSSQCGLHSAKKRDLTPPNEADALKSELSTVWRDFLGFELRSGSDNSSDTRFHSCRRTDPVTACVKRAILATLVLSEIQLSFSQ